MYKLTFDIFRETYAKIEVVVSSPIVPFRETIIDPPKLDMVNEEIIKDSDDNSSDKVIVLTTPNKQCRISLIAVPLPMESIELIEKHQDLIKNETSGVILAQEFIEAKDAFEKGLKESLVKSIHQELHGEILSYGPKKVGTNLLVSSCSSLLGDKYLSSVINGFQLATVAGPLCEEPLSGKVLLYV